MKKQNIAIDGPAGAGKSTVAQLVAQRLHYTYIDTGAMYRAIAWKVLTSAIDIQDQAALQQLMETTNVRLSYQDGRTAVFVDDREITAEIRQPEISRLVPEIAKQGLVRTALVDMQRQMATAGGVVMDGRDIGTHVLPAAEIKVFLTASIEERAQRRHRELTEKGFPVDLAELAAEIAERDRKDSQREISPLVQAADATLLDTTKLSIDEAVQAIMSMCKE